MSQLNDLIAERAKTHGSWVENARLAQQMKEEWRKAEGWKRLSMGQREGLERIAEKIARILAGDSNHLDHWMDIAGYAKLVVRELENGGKDE
jgi:hypothetical protein